MSNYLVDTNVIIDFLRGIDEAGKLLEKIDQVNISAVTAAEIIQGARNKKELNSLDNLFANFNVIPINQHISSLGVNLLKEYTLSDGLLILDSLIAATAIVKDLSLISANTKHFQMISQMNLLHPSEF